MTFTTFTLCASFILFRGFNTTDAVNTISLLCGFLIIFSGVYLLNLSREDPEGHRLLAERDGEMDGLPTDPIAGLHTRRSMQLRRSEEARRSSVGSLGRNPRLMHSYTGDEELGANGHYGVGELASSDDEDDGKHPGYDAAPRRPENGFVRQ